jgi:dTDP-4-amino-4,6-dideoxygalactose transaminase
MSGVSKAELRAVPFVDLARTQEPIRAGIDAAIARVLDSGAYILGPDVEAFEREWSAYCGAEHAVGVGSGTSAIGLVLEALEIGPGDEVIAPALTFIATVIPVLRLGATPVLVDAEPATATIDPDAVRAALTERTKAILAVHLYGQPADMDELSAIAESAGIHLIEDAAQAHGARYRGRRAGSLGYAACFSFYPSKNLGALGDGGAVVTSDAELAQRVRVLRDLGQVSKYEHISAAPNERLDTVQAAVLREKLPHLDAWNETRRAAAARYGDDLESLELDLPVEGDGREHVWHLYVVLSEERDRVRGELGEAGIATGLHYPLPLHLEPVLASLGHERGAFPVAEDWSFRGFSLPMFAGIEEEEVAAVVEALRRATTSAS